MLLSVRNVTKKFDGLVALSDVSMDVGDNEILGLIGPNGSGKTTLINAISQVYELDAGSIFFQDERIDNLKPHEIALRGIGRTFQITRVFRRLTVFENALVPAAARLHGISRDRMEEDALGRLRFVGLEGLKDEYASDLSGGQQRLLEFVRALAQDPQLFLLDEPFAGVHPDTKNRIIDAILKLKNGGKSFILVSHDIESIFNLSNRMVVLSEGKKIAEGVPAEVRSDAEVARVYLGV